MPDYITPDYLSEFLDVSDKSPEAKAAAITSASLEFDRYAGVASGYFDNTTRYPDGVPDDVRMAVTRLAVASLRGSDPVSMEAAGITSADIKALRDAAKDVAFAYKRDIEAALALATSLTFGSSDLQTTGRWF